MLLWTLGSASVVVGAAAWILRRQLVKHEQQKVDDADRQRIVRSIAATEYQRRRTDRIEHEDFDARRGIQWSPRRPPVPRGKAR